MSLNQASSGRSPGSLMSGRQDAPRVVGVAPHLRGERRETRKARLIAQLRGEFDLELAPVEVAAEIEYVRFEERLDTPDGRPRAETRDTGERLAGHAPDAHRENARDRRPAGPRRGGCGAPRRSVAATDSRARHPKGGSASARGATSAARGDGPAPGIPAAGARTSGAPRAQRAAPRARRGARAMPGARDGCRRSSRWSPRSRRPVILFRSVPE